MKKDLSNSSFTLPAGILTRGTRYFWKVTAYDLYGDSMPSNEVFQFKFLKLGDANLDGHLTPADIVVMLNHIFLGVPLDPVEVADVECDGVVGPDDIVIELTYVFRGTPPWCDP